MVTRVLWLVLVGRYERQVRGRSWLGRREDCPMLHVSLEGLFGALFFIVVGLRVG